MSILSDNRTTFAVPEITGSRQEIEKIVADLAFRINVDLSCTHEHLAAFVKGCLAIGADPDAMLAKHGLGLGTTLARAIKYVPINHAINSGELWRVPGWARQAIGGIRDPQRYVRAKCMDHSQWKMPGKRSPSDIDFVLEVEGYILAVEFKEGGG